MPCGAPFRGGSSEGITQYGERRRWWLKTTGVVTTGQQGPVAALKITGLAAGTAIAYYMPEMERIGAA